MKKKLKRIWTWGYRPFIMGGRCNYVLACDWECDGPHDLGGGYTGWVATAPNGVTRVVEDKSGAIVGDSLSAVRQDIKDGDPKVMNQQLEEAIAQAKEAEVKSAEHFWMVYLENKYPEGAIP